ncbi:cytochrome c1 [Candidatus Methylospira mobilis]|uniref:cytochrome c1 n=1 Tax=Candidatus Methylospira mobilis TaxID=1808979 RepID=UPI0028E73752|nr:cytochrome c1 [Candidatus Methylospira mobilis]WNV03490.1 cytochrome c1 [Candidatus Methylospira mobilis]
MKNHLDLQKKLLFCAMLLWAAAAGAGGAAHLQDADVDVFDIHSVRRGTEYYVSYCIGCHSVKHLRYSRFAGDYGLSEQEMSKSIMMADARVHDTMQTAMRSRDGEVWFGVAPPDLSLIARARGADWLYTYLKGFYLDPSRPTGSNNLVFFDVGMPNVLWELQGMQKPVYRKTAGVDAIDHLVPASQGRMTEAQFDQAVTDIVNFLVYAAEPGQLQRIRTGKYVLFGLLIFVVLFYKLKKIYWKGIE